jgi:Fic family protein
MPQEESIMGGRPAGEYVTVSSAGGEQVQAFLPYPLPGITGLDIEAPLQRQLDRALLELGRLDSVAVVLPSTQLFLYMYVRKEALLSSQIEGTQSSLSDLLLFELQEAPGVPEDDVREVSNYSAAIEHGLRRLGEGFPFSGRLLRELHALLLRSGRGASRMPGEFRRSQNWIGGTRPGNARFVPPPADRVPGYISDLERWIHGGAGPIPALVKVALAHVQFETIHPFLDGNGRVGRLMIPLLLWEDGILKEPLLYLSLYLKDNRERYYELLQNVRREGDWNGWLMFFAEGVAETAAGAVATARRITTLIQSDRERLGRVGRGAGSTLRVHEALTRRPVNNITRLHSATGLSKPAVIRALIRLESIGLVEEVSGRKRNRIYVYRPYLDILAEGTEPLR